ncbi:chromosomal replication initiator protein DnaA, DNA-binding transcriptional dual regulator [Magnetospirillum sp. XM-1]|uniref:chromosomal replication initiator protein DnaA n=1 Tax=Magnetospirillum sp. XM-1 TaxID=1663591 RepID=UPI00073DCEB3|nr:chromosomal replication initiator protein DnaA [Magnetospirillum sp. XM-1]CUW37071.1 chromosomal replication initiator protein DnaA, DNA-binding transcriptional dual regulator [Magnetospirillum sp. XM-1]
MVKSEWDRVKVRLKDEVGDAAYRSWLRPITLHGMSDDAVKLALPTRFMRDWVNTHYAERIRTLWGAENPAIRNVEIVVEAARAVSAAKTAPPQAAAIAAAPKAAPVETPRPAAPCAPAAAPAADADELGAPLDTRFTFKNFVVGKPNEFAWAAARRVAEADQVSFNPLFLYGGVGLGKTHLMHAIAHHIRERNPERSVLYLSAEKFMYRFIRALRGQDTMSFKEQFRSVDVLMIDDVQFIAGKDATQEEFFHTFNALVDQGSQIVISADKSPSDLEGIEERLRSRMACGLVADIHATTYELRLGILQSKAEQMGVIVPQKVMEFLAHKIISNVRELEGALNRVVAHSQLVGRTITLETTQEVLHDLLRASDRRITIEEIQKKVAEHFTIKLAEMSSARRSRQVARPRQIAMYLAKQLTSRSLPEIGRKFGGRDHTTVMHAVKKVEELKEVDQNFAEDVELLRRMLQG